MRVALATVGTTGDVRPFAALADALVAREHEVTAVSWPVHRATLSRAGVRFVVAGPHADPARLDATAEAAAARSSPMDQVAILRDLHLADGEAHLRTLREVLAGHDLVVLHSIHALAHAAVLDLAAPWASVVFDPVLLPTRASPPPGMPQLGPLNPAAWWLLDRALARVGRPLDAVLEHAGSRRRSLPLFRARSTRLHLVACSPALVAVPPDLPPTTHVTGAWTVRSAPSPLPDDVDAFMAGGRPPVIITFGSMRGVPAAELEAAVRSLVAGGERVVVQGPPAAARNDGASVIRVGEVDHRALFPRVAVVVHHGGAGTTHAAAAAGVPSVVVPHVGDQRYWADRLHRLGMAPPPLAVGRLSGALLANQVRETILDGQMSAAARDVAVRMATEDGIAAAVSLIEASGRA